MMRTALFCLLFMVGACIHLEREYPDVDSIEITKDVASEADSSVAEAEGVSDAGTSDISEVEVSVSDADIDEIGDVLDVEVDAAADIVAELPADVAEEVEETAGSDTGTPDSTADADTEIGDADVVDVADTDVSVVDTFELPEPDAPDVSETDSDDVGPDVLDVVEPLCQTDSDCDDGDDCTDDTCDLALGCVYQEVVPCMIFVPAGLYMDSPTSAGVPVASFWMDRHEVRVKDYATCVNAGVCSAPASASSFFPACTWGGSDGNKPVNCATVDQAKTYCGYVLTGGRLPTRDEYKKATRGGCELNGSPACNAADDYREYPWGNAPPSCSFAIFNDDGDKGCGAFGPWPVGALSPAGDSPYGIADLVGNVWETLDEECGNGYSVLGGGSWETAPEFMTIDWYYCVGAATQQGGHHNAGFRCVVDDVNF